MFQISVNNITLVNFLNSLGDLSEDIVSLALWQLVYIAFTEVVEKVTTFHVFGDDERLGPNRELLDDLDYVGIVNTHIHSLAFT